MGIEKLSETQIAIIDEISPAFDRLGAERGIFAALHSWGDTMSDLEVLQMLKEQNNSVGEHHLERELDGANNMMCFLVDDIEISHYLMSYINNKGNMEDWQESLCINAAFVIDELRSEVKRLRSLNTD